MKVMTCYWQK